MKEVSKLLEKIEKFKEHKLDLSAEEDLSVAIMNLVSIEEHMFFSGAKTKDERFFDLLHEAREIRKELMRKIVRESEGETWCISKHLLAACMRLIEVGTKYWSRGDKDDANMLFSKAYDLYSMFWGINLGIIDVGDVKLIEDDKLNVHDEEEGSILSKLGRIVKKILDCCRE